MSEIKVDITKVHHNPYQPLSRQEVPEEIAKKFGLSILKHGMISTPVGRRVDGPGLFEMADGWLRLKGHEWLVSNGHLEYQEIRFDERELSDQQMADMVMEANSVRHDLNPIEEALLYQRYIKDFGISETQLAKDHDLTQGAVANTIRLLQLPADLQEKVKAGELSSTHGRTLLRMNKVPEMQRDMAERCIKQNTSVSELANSVESTLWRSSKSLNPKGDRWDRPIFDLTECKSCESMIHASEPYGSQKKEDRCLNEKCWEKKQAEATQKAVREAQQDLKKEGVKQKVLSRDQVSYGQYENMRDYLHLLDNPAECKKCPKTALYKYDLTSSGKPDLICLDPPCHRKKQTKHTRDTNKLKKEQDKDLTMELSSVFKQAHGNPRGCIEVLARHMLPMVDAAGKLDLCAIFDNIPKLANGRMDQDALLASLSSKNIDELLDLTMAAAITRRRRKNWEQFSIRLTEEEKHDIAIMTGTMDRHLAEVKTFQEANCRGCFYSDDEKIGTSGEPCRNSGWAKKIGEDGKCTGRKEQEKKEATSEVEMEEGEEGMEVAVTE